MYFLPTWIIVSLVAATALPSSDLEGLDTASLPSLDLPSSELSPLGATTPGDGPDLLGANLDQSLNFLEPSTFSSQIAQLPGANSAETSSTFSPQIPQLPGANSAGTSSIIDPSTTDTTAQTHMDASTDVCNADRSTGQKVQKRQDSCPNGEYFLRRPELPKINYAERTKEQLENDRKARVDKKWLDEKKKEDWLPLLEPGRDWCERFWGEVDDRPNFANPLCCLGPKEFITVPTLGLRRVRRQSVTLMNVHNCLLFLVGRPFCMWEEQRFCCKQITVDYQDWGFKGLDCAEMHWDNYPTVGARLNPII